MFWMSKNGTEHICCNLHYLFIYLFIMLGESWIYTMFDFEKEYNAIQLDCTQQIYHVPFFNNVLTNRNVELVNIGL